MAMTAESLRGPLRFQIDLKNGLIQQPIRPQLMKGDRKANTVIVALTEDKKTVDLAGVTVTGGFISPVGGAEIPLVGSVSGNEASVTLIDECYAQDGFFECNIMLTVGETTRTILSFTGHVLSKGSGAVIDIGDVIPSIDDIIAQYAEMKRVTQETQEAANAANAAAGRAPYVENGTWRVWDAAAGAYKDTGIQARGPQGEKGDPGEVTKEQFDQLSEQKVDKTSVVNDFTTTEDGFVADAKALKTLNDKFNKSTFVFTPSSGISVITTRLVKNEFMADVALELRAETTVAAYASLGSFNISITGIWSVGMVSGSLVEFYMSGSNLYLRKEITSGNVVRLHFTCVL